MIAAWQSDGYACIARTGMIALCQSDGNSCITITRTIGACQSDGHACTAHTGMMWHVRVMVMLLRRTQE
ncbi:hypothetical protein PsorP6_011591 [Peronosclerospora sorghi]|uniref:Uncharacterized protein n=1 Tax=Peronosclerospora sorghi TaxID=230839 RepID=A0ACC0WJ36_9STRA|nr:hypothetical protein PsorP6_011591 [Peronosclerospora sorghi]